MSFYHIYKRYKETVFKPLFLLSKVNKSDFLVSLTAFQVFGKDKTLNKIKDDEESPSDKKVKDVMTLDIERSPGYLYSTWSVHF